MDFMKLNIQMFATSTSTNLILNNMGGASTDNFILGAEESLEKTSDTVYTVKDYTIAKGDHTFDLSSSFVPTKIGYTFIGWYSDEALTTAITTISISQGSSANVYAKWKINSYTITFNSNGGGDVSAITQDYNTTVTAPTTPTKEGYVFDGWYADSSLTNEYTFSTMPAENITLYAKWRTETIKFYLDKEKTKQVYPDVSPVLEDIKTLLAAI